MKILNSRSVIVAFLALILLPEVKKAIEIQRVEAISNTDKDENSCADDQKGDGQQVMKQTMQLSPKINLIPPAPDRIIMFNNLELEYEESSDDESEEEEELEQKPLTVTHMTLKEHANVHHNENASAQTNNDAASNDNKATVVVVGDSSSA